MAATSIRFYYKDGSILMANIKDENNVPGVIEEHKNNAEKILVQKYPLSKNKAIDWLKECK